MIKKLIKKIVGKKLLSNYHYFLARSAAWFYGSPSEKMIVIGVTGTNGKTSTVNIISQYLDCLQKKNGLASTVNFKVGEKKWLNKKKMTMLGRFQTQGLLKQMLKKGCEYAIIETSSQGIEQHRHVGINYDVLIFTNLSPEHIEAHGGFENYRAAKEKLFSQLNDLPRKIIKGQKINKIIISNADDLETARLKKYAVDKFVTYAFQNTANYQGQDLSSSNGSITFSLKEKKISAKYLGSFNAYNVLAALTCIDVLNLNLDLATACNLRGIPGRQEWIKQGQNFKVLVDYAPEPESLRHLYEAIKEVNRARLIHVLGSCGGGRDKARRPILGKMAGENADLVIVTNEDPYDDDPQMIIDNVAQGALEAGKELNKTLFKYLDRRKAIKKALGEARENDLVLITGKGAEQYICIANEKKIPWDDRQVVKEELVNLNFPSK
jgi:UDP-N-acetylmuramoyl-L-alanyl-D-glutamate--2,6-diaminopimelate ligase